MLPNLNADAVRKSYSLATALKCSLNPVLSFDRKNYFYPDMPKNYQITQHAAPLGLGGELGIELDGGLERTIRFHDIHLEEDAGKMIHRSDRTLVDFNRAGTPLLEIVTEPDLKSGVETEQMLRQFQRVVRYAGVGDANMEEGSMRCDANVSINPPGVGLGSKVEIKNLNSPRFVRLAIEYEVLRQSKLMARGEPILQETRLWDERTGKTSSMRSKEDAQDYRYFPEPDLPPLSLEGEFLNSLMANVVELPLDRKRRLREAYRINEGQLEAICSELSTVNFFEATVEAGAPAGRVAAFLTTEVRKHLNREGVSLEESRISPGSLASLIELEEQGKISNKVAREVLELMFREGGSPAEIVASQGLAEQTDEGELGRLVDEILDANPKVVASIVGGDDRQIGFLMGQLMKRTGGKANPQLARRIIGERLEVD